MIEIADKSLCCGCEACVQRCPVECIEMREDREGFRYPHIDTSRCIDCGACEGLCPEFGVEHRDRKLFAAKAAEENISAASSSGGVFTLLGEQVLARGGVLFGAKFDSEWQVVHSAVDNSHDMSSLRGAKYSQSSMGESYKLAEELLHEGREVLFSGTPCQIAALRALLGRDYPTLLTAEVACHGVPSPKVWRKYLDSLGGGAAIKRVNFRDKVNGWSDYHITISTNDAQLSERAVKNIYMSGFVKSLFLRPSCHNCPSKGGGSGADITLADFWGVFDTLPHFASQRGVSLVATWSSKGAQRLAEIGGGDSPQAQLLELSAEQSEAALRANPSIYSSATMPPKRAQLFEAIDGDVVARLRRLLRVPFYTKIIREIKWAIARRKENRG